MKRNHRRVSLRRAALILLVPLPLTVLSRSEQPTAAATAAFDSYIQTVEARLGRQHGSAAGFLAATDDARLRSGEAGVVIDQVSADPARALPGAMLHHWRGTAFVPGARARDFECLMRDFAGYPKYFSPEVLTARVSSQDGGRYRVTMRVEQKHILTVVLDTSYNVSFGRLDAQHRYSISRSTQITEIEHAGAKDERALTPAQNHGFLWRLNTYWSCAERDGGLHLQIETVSLTRAIPPGLGWAIGPFVESVPRESLEFTLRAVRNALRAEEASGTTHAR